MTEANKLHQEAMTLLDEATLARLRGDRSAAIEAQQQAFERERAAAELLAERWELEPTRSILYKGAAVLALECGQGEQAASLARDGLRGTPPAHVAQVLREVAELAAREEAKQREATTRQEDRLAATAPR